MSNKILVLDPPSESKFDLIDDDIYRSLAQYTAIEDSAAHRLGKAVNPAALMLNGLQELSPGSAKGLAAFTLGIQLNGLRHLTPPAAQSLKGAKGSLSLDGLTQIGVDELACIGSARGGYLSLNGLEAITEPQAKSLRNRRGDVSLNGVKQLDAECAASLRSVKGALALNGLTSISDEAASRLARHVGGLSLDGLETISDSVAKSLGQTRGDLSLRGLKDLTADQAKYLSKHSGGSLYLTGLRKLTDEAAEQLSQHSGFRLDLSGLATISDACAKSLSHYRGYVLELNGLASVTGTASEILNSHSVARLERKAARPCLDKLHYANVSNRTSYCLTNSIGMKLLAVGPGAYRMGVEGDEYLPAHEATVKEPFCLGVYQVTQSQYARVMNKNPSAFMSPLHPVQSVSWHDAAAFCNRLSDMPEEKLNNRTYRLPTETEWEYACRAGTSTVFSFGDSESELSEYAWYSKNSDLPKWPNLKHARQSTRPVGAKMPNAWGFFDMHGNVFEWVDGFFEVDVCTEVTCTIQPGINENGDAHYANRGGSYWNEAKGCSSTFRRGNHPQAYYPYIGFRVAFSIGSNSGK